MVDLIIVAYDTEATAEAARKKLLELQKEYLIELGDAVVAVRQPDGHVKLNQLISMTAVGAASGGMWGALIGLLFLNPLLGAAIGAGAGALGGRSTDIGIDDNFMKQAAGRSRPGRRRSAFWCARSRPIRFCPSWRPSVARCCART